MAPSSSLHVFLRPTSPGLLLRFWLHLKLVAVISHLHMFSGLFEVLQKHQASSCLRTSPLLSFSRAYKYDSHSQCAYVVCYVFSITLLTTQYILVLRKLFDQIYLLHSTLKLHEDRIMYFFVHKNFQLYLCSIVHKCIIHMYLSWYIFQ